MHRLNDPNLAPFQAKTLLANLDDVGVQPSKATAEANTRFQNHQARKPTITDSQALTTAWLDGEDTQSVAVAVLTSEIQMKAWNHALQTLARRLLSTITADGDAIVAALAKKADTLIEHMTRAAALKTTDTTALIRAGNQAGAELAANIDIYAGELHRLYELRDEVCSGADFGHNRVNCGHWKDPRPVDTAMRTRATPPTTAGFFTLGIKAGGQLWFPTPGQAQTEARRIAAEVEAEHTAARIEQARRGNVLL